MAHEVSSKYLDRTVTLLYPREINIAMTRFLKQTRYFSLSQQTRSERINKYKKKKEMKKSDAIINFPSQFRCFARQLQIEILFSRP